jgi:hypothetical protein
MKTVPDKSHVVFSGTPAEMGASHPQTVWKILDNYETIRTILLRLEQALYVVSKYKSKNWYILQRWQVLMK